MTINVSEHFGCLILLRKRREGTTRAVDGGVADGQDSYHDDGVEYRRQNLDPSVVYGYDERRSDGIGFAFVLFLQQFFCVVGHEETDNEQGNNVEEGDAPEDLLDSSWERLARVRSLGCSEANKLGSGEGKCSVDKGSTEALEAVVEGSRVVPVFEADVPSIGTSTDVDDDAQDDETDDCGNLDDGEYELGFTIALDTEQIDTHDQGQEDGHPGIVVHLSMIPEADGVCRGDNLQWQYNKPLEGVAVVS